MLKKIRLILFFIIFNFESSNFKLSKINLRKIFKVAVPISVLGLVYLGYLKREYLKNKFLDDQKKIEGKNIYKNLQSSSSNNNLKNSQVMEDKYIIKLEKIYEPFFIEDVGDIQNVNDNDFDVYDIDKYIGNKGSYKVYEHSIESFRSKKKFKFLYLNFNFEANLVLNGSYVNDINVDNVNFNILYNEGLLDKILKVDLLIKNIKNCKELLEISKSNIRNIIPDNLKISKSNIRNIIPDNLKISKSNIRNIIPDNLKISKSNIRNIIPDNITHDLDLYHENLKKIIDKNIEELNKVLDFIKNY